ncbi:hypothetical protein [Nocardia otitidiscaviarum]|uniref:hypothetical protein n=1 Tax=Nocardia otitidiscaviarum TaxID=1823 RepID=UPI002455ACD9|nr:hypothetical protein [Nocardia otitidiscaviarum]
MADEDHLVARARTALLELLENELAVVWSEAEAKLGAEVRGHRHPDAIYPHHLTTAKNELLAERKITATEGETRGGSEIQTFSPADTKRRTTRIRQAAQRKRLLMARFRGWAHGPKNSHGQIGPAGEAAVRQALIASTNFALENSGGEVAEILGVKLKGSLDAGGWLTLFGTNHVPKGTACVALEVKNIRDFIYPNSHELYQVLDKAAHLQRERPDALVHPVLVCRRVNHTLFFMAYELGFKVVQTQRQYIRGVEIDPLNEVRAELGFLDLTLLDPATPDPHLIKAFRQQIPKDADEYCERWRDSVLTHNLDRYFPLLRNKNLRLYERADIVNELRASTAAIDRGSDVRQGGW